MKNLIKIALCILFFFVSIHSFTIAQNDSTNGIKKIDSTAQTVVKATQDTSKSTEATSENGKGLTPPSVGEIISVQKIFWAIIFFIIGLYLIKLATKVLDIFAEKSTSYRITIKGLIPIVRILAWTLVFYLIIKGIFKPPAETIIAVLASLGIAVGFASQDIFRNIFGGIMILFDRPFSVGDKIEIDSYYGEVIKIGLRSTRIVTPDDSMVSIPNGDLMNKSVSNSNTGEPNCQVVAELFLPIEIDTERVRKIALEAAKVSRYVYLKKPIVVLFFNEVKEDRSYLKMRLKAYVLDIRFEFAFKSDMTEIVMRELIKEGIVNPAEMR
jgi:small-conductance mechanosensitive channel